MARKPRNRGQSKPKLRDLGRQWPTDQETQALIDAISRREQHPVVIAIVGACLLEFELERAMRHKLTHITDKEWEDLTGRDGPFATFSGKIIAASALRVIDPIIRDGLHTVRLIRNAFAHSKRPLTFDNPLIVKELESVTLPTRERSAIYRDLLFVQGKDKRDEPYPISGRYAALCLILSTYMLRAHTRRRKNAMRQAKRRHRHRLGKLLLRRSALSPTQEYFAPLFAQNQSEGSALQVPPGSRSLLDLYLDKKKETKE